MLNWANRFNICSFLATQQYTSTLHFQDTLVAVGAVQQLTVNASVTAKTIDAFIQQQRDWIFFHFSFEALDVLQGRKTIDDPSGFSPFCFFVPQYVFQLSNDQLVIESLHMDHEKILEQIGAEPFEANSYSSPVTIQPSLSREQYLQKINGLLAHIHRGDCYEINFCQTFFAENALVNPVKTWLDLCVVSPNPFSCFYKNGSAHLLCASPERFLCKKEQRLISQPMKGTIRRDITDPAQDALLKQQLQESAKDRRENVMVVDLVRNDLSKVCKEGTVVVSELFGVYAYPQVFQMISTIEGEIRSEVGFMDVLEACFPMGSMTGAPKHRVLELIRTYEEAPRGLFSGTIGYIHPNGDVDMNVVIRSLFYNAATQYLFYMTGSGITASSIPEQEYDECLLKGSAIRQILS